MRPKLRFPPRALLGVAARVLAGMGLAALALELGACSASADGVADDGMGVGGSGGTGGTGGSGGQGQPLLTLAAFTADDAQMIAPEQLKPLDVVDIVATLTPADGPDVRFALLDSGGESPLDATLNATTVTPEYGQAHVTLTAPSTPTSFTVRASAMGYETALLDLQVRKTNLAELAVSPMCSEPSAPGCTGDRGHVIDTYVASVWPNAKCADLEGNPPDDGDLTKEGPPPVAIAVPSDVTLAVVLRAAKFAWGCADVSAATEGAPNSVTVVMANVPLTLDTSDLDFTLGVDSYAALDSALAAPKEDILTSVLGSASDDVQALLDAMRAELADPSGFDATRKSEQWDTYLGNELGASASEALRAPLGSWLDAGVESLHQSTGIEGNLKGIPGESAPTLTLSSVLGLSPTRSGFEPLGTPTWEAAPNDSVLIGMGMTFDPKTLLLGAALAPAVADVSGSKGVADALSNAVPCQLVADTLVAHGETSGHSSDACDAVCTKKLCASAVASLLSAAGMPSATPATLQVALTAAGQVGDDAELTGFDGTWLGRLKMPDVDSPTSLTGTAQGTAVAPSP